MSVYCAEKINELRFPQRCKERKAIVRSISFVCLSSSSLNPYSVVHKGNGKNCVASADGSDGGRFTNLRIDQLKLTRRYFISRSAGRPALAARPCPLTGLLVPAMWYVQGIIYSHVSMNSWFSFDSLAFSQSSKYQISYMLNQDSNFIYNVFNSFIILGVTMPKNNFFHNYL